MWLVPVAIITIVATGCPAPGALAPPPPSPPAPTILSSSITPTVVAGQAITADVVTTHPFSHVSEMGIQLTGPGGATLPYGDGDVHLCSRSYIEPVSSITPIDATTFETTLSCTMPTYATNGTWTATIGAYVSNYQSASVTTTFEVTGGTDGPSDPVITMIAAPPATAARGSSFPIEYQIDDVALDPSNPLLFSQPVNFILLSSTLGTEIGAFNCEDPVTTQVTPRLLDIARTCSVGATLHTGVYTSYLLVIDQLGFSARTDFAVTVN